MKKYTGIGSRRGCPKDVAVLIIDFFRNKLVFTLSYSHNDRIRQRTINPSAVKWRYKLIYASIIFCASLWYLSSAFGVYDYIQSQTMASKLYENEYVDPSKVDFQFPEKKRNLIYIYMESMENTLGSKANGGTGDVSYIPELEGFATNGSDVSFSRNQNALGGGYVSYAASWTVAGIVAQSAGIPLKNEFGAGTTFESGNGMGEYKKFLPGAYMLGDVLEAQGYNQMFMLGSDPAFGGRDKLFSQHGNYAIFDLQSAKDAGKISPDYDVWWGYEDKKLFEYAKEAVTNLSEKDAPFNFQMLTADTHFIDGYMDPSCPQPYDQQYLNVYACSSKQVADFVAWVQAQPFADNTTIVICGDHLGMQNEFYDGLIGDDENYLRTIYNAFINAAVTVTNEERYNRMFSTIDMYPTTLAALGVTIPGNRLGLGTNLFSSESTLIEKYSHDGLNDELRSKSYYYNERILAD
jgi:phosphoglycerol transferase